jgi:hypothetical protein
MRKGNWILLAQVRIHWRTRCTRQRTFIFHNWFVPDFKQKKKKNSYTIFPHAVTSLVAKNPAKLYKKDSILMLIHYEGTLGVIRRCKQMSITPVQQITKLVCYLSHDTKGDDSKAK